MHSVSSLHSQRISTRTTKTKVCLQLVVLFTSDKRSCRSDGVGKVYTLPWPDGDGKEADGKPALCIAAHRKHEIAVLVRMHERKPQLGYEHLHSIVLKEGVAAPSNQGYFGEPIVLKDAQRVCDLLRVVGFFAS